jgi:hypothetical protein
LEIVEPARMTLLVSALDEVISFSNRVRCPSRFSLQFTLADGTVENFGYLGHDGVLPLFWGDRGGWEGRAIAPTVTFATRFQSLLAAE